MAWLHCSRFLLLSAVKNPDHCVCEHKGEELGRGGPDWLETLATEGQFRSHSWEFIGHPFCSKLELQKVARRTRQWVCEKEILFVYPKSVFSLAEVAGKRQQDWCLENTAELWPDITKTLWPVQHTSTGWLRSLASSSVVEAYGTYFNTSMEGDVKKRVLYLLEANRTFGEMGPLPLPHRTLTIPMLAWESDHYNLLTAAREAVSIGVMVKTSGYPESPSVMGNPWHGKHKKQARKPDFCISLLPCLYGYRGNVQNT